MIPKTIHWCWFGHGKASALIDRCVESWKRHCPGYAIKVWDEGSFDVGSVRFVKEAYQMKKWAFVSDYVRLYALYTEGGVYLDSDVEVLRPIDRFLSCPAFTGFEMPGFCLTGIMGSEKGGAWVGEMLKEYDNRSFILDGGKLNLDPNLSYATKIMKAKGVDFSGHHISIPGYVDIYPRDFFCPKRHEDGKIVLTDNTYVIHHFAGSWLSPSKKFAKWAGQHTTPLVEYYINYFCRNPAIVAHDLLGFAKRHLG